MKELQSKIIFVFSILIIIISLVLPIFFLYSSEMSTYSTSRASGIGSVKLSVASVCGDGSCDAATEDCSSCSQDCGGCPAASTGGTGGSSGGGGGISKLINFVFDPDLIDEKFEQGESFEKIINVKNIGARFVYIILKVSELEDMIFLDKKELDIAKGNSDEFLLSILVAENKEPGVYLGDVIGKVGDFEKNLMLVISVFEKDALIFVDVDVDEDSASVQPGDKVMGTINITSKYNESVSASIEYSIKDKDKNIISSKEESIYLASGETIFKQGLKTDKDLDPDYYFFYTIVSYDSKNYEDADAFKIEESEEYLFSGRDIIYGIIVFLALLLLLILVYVFRRKLFKFGIPFGRKKKKKEEEIKVEGIRAITPTVKKLAQLKLKLNKENYDEKLIKEYFDIMRHFFSNYYSISYRFTFQELSRELTQRKIKSKTRIISFINVISDLSYLESTMSKSEFKGLLDRTISLVKSLRPHEIKKIKKKSKKK